MLTLAYVRTMATYNSEMNRRLYAAAGRLSDAERKRDRGAFWRSIHGTFSHLLWADRAWMARFTGAEVASVPAAESDRMFEAFDEMAAVRAEEDLGIESWAAALDEAWLAGDLSWFSAVYGKEITAPCGLLVAHLFNHQTHHRGQAHAMLTAAGEDTGATDLPMIV